MIKLIGIILIVFSTTYLGFNKSRLYQKRIDELIEFKNGVEKLKTEITFIKLPLYDAFSKISKCIEGNVSDIFNEFSKKINVLDGHCIYDIWDLTIGEHLQKCSLNKSDIKIMRDFGKMLGSTDLEGQITNFSSVLDLIEHQISEAYIEKEKNAGLYQSFGVYTGILIAILLI